MYADKHIFDNNLSTWNKAIRYSVAVVLVGQIFFLTDVMNWQAYLVIIGVYLATTALCGVAPFSSLLRHLHSGKPSNNVHHIGSEVQTVDPAMRGGAKNEQDVQRRVS